MAFDRSGLPVLVNAEPDGSDDLVGINGSGEGLGLVLCFDDCAVRQRGPPHNTALLQFLREQAGPLAVVPNDLQEIAEVVFMMHPLFRYRADG